MKVISSANVSKIFSIVKGWIEEKYSAVMAAVEGKGYQTEAQVKALAKSAADEAKAELIGGAPETYDTLKEVADYISSHKSVETALNAAIGQKANADDVYTKTETDDKIAEVVAGSVDLTPYAKAADVAAGYVAKETGKGLSSNDYTSAEKTKLSDLPAKSDLDAALAGKVDSSNLTEMTEAEIQAVATEVWSAA